MSLAFEIAVIVFLVLLNGWFAMSELATAVIVTSGSVDIDPG